MGFDVFLNFDGNCREAVDFYAKVFKVEKQKIMTYGEMPPSDDFKIDPKDKDKVLYTFLPIFGSNFMFCDNPSNMKSTKGNNIALSIGSKNKDEIKTIFDALKEGGKVEMELQKTFWSDFYGMLIDKFGIPWQITYEDENYKY